jgi:hypothetical protein
MQVGVKEPAAFSLLGVDSMKTLPISILTSMVVASSLFMPVFAKDGNEVLQDYALLPVRTLSLASGLTVGTAIAITRKTTSNIAVTTDSMVPEDQKDFVPSWILAGTLGIPVGIITGTLEGAHIGVKNALNSFVSDDPLSLQSISLSKLD